MSESDYTRLDKTVNRVDEAVTRLTILEERMQQQARTLERLFTILDENTSRLQKMETNQAISQTKIGFNERVVWIFISVLIGAASYFIRGM